MSLITQSQLTGEPNQLEMLTLNVAFLKEIKEDNVNFKELLKSVHQTLRSSNLEARSICELLSRLRDELETHFALEEFYGYFGQAEATNFQVSQAATTLICEHEKLYLELNDLVEESEKLVYEEPTSKDTDQLVDEFDLFYQRLQVHEMQEMELMQKLWNEEFGVGD